MNLDNMLFKRGYLITDSGQTNDLPTPVSEWPTKKIGDYAIFYHPSIESTFDQKQSFSLALLGTVIDPITSTHNSDIIASNILDSINKGREYFYEYIDNLSGRFIILINSKHETFALQDATGTKTLYYDTEGDQPLLSSHAEIIARMKGYRKSRLWSEIDKVNGTYYPGIASPYSEIDRLTPNTLIVLPSSKIQRFFPRKPLPSNNIGDVVDDISNILITQMNLMNDSHDIALSLSAGLDSRVSLAATKQIADEVDYYSWRSPKNNNNSELNAVNNICKTIGTDKNHQIIDLNQQPTEEWNQLFKTHTANSSPQGRSWTAYNFYTSFPDNKTEIRSNVGEIGRASYRNHVACLPKTVSPETLTKLYYKSSSKIVTNEFDRFIRTTSFPINSIYNYDVYDLVHWELKNGNWLSQWLLEKDLSHNNFVAFNNRKLLIKLLSVDRQHRKSGEVFLELIKHMWPECLNIPINPHKNDFWSKHAKTAKRLTMGGLFRLPMPIFRNSVERIQEFKSDNVVVDEGSTDNTHSA